MYKIRLLPIITIFSSFTLISCGFEKPLPTNEQVKEIYSSDQQFEAIRNNPDLAQIVDVTDIKCVKTGARNFIVGKEEYKRYDYRCEANLVLSNGQNYPETLELYRKDRSELIYSDSYYYKDVDKALWALAAKKAFEENGLSY